MKAIVYKGPRDVVVKKVPDAKIRKATDVLVKITTTDICGSDLHMYEGRTNMEPGRIFVCPMPTSTAWCSRPMLMKKKMITLCF
jgi:threonine dehydrogenase-like Zn-dependent dehydrogenase